MILTEKFGMTEAGTMKPWMFASYHFADGARGATNGFVDYLKANPKGVFLGTESPRILSNGVRLSIHSVQ